MITERALSTGLRNGMTFSHNSRAGTDHFRSSRPGGGGHGAKRVLSRGKRASNGR